MCVCVCVLLSYGRKTKTVAYFQAACGIRVRSKPEVANDNDITRGVHYDCCLRPSQEKRTHFFKREKDFEIYSLADHLQFTIELWIIYNINLEIK